MRFLAAHVRGLTRAFGVAVVVLLAVSAALGLEHGTTDAADIAFAVELAIFMLGFAVLGVLIARREPLNPVGWLFCAVPLGVLLGTASGMYTESGHTAADAVGWLSTWTWLTALLAYALFVPLLFPDGRVPGPRWRYVAWLDAGVLVAVFIAAAADIEVLGVAAVVAAVALVPVSLASVVVRYRRSEGTERLQLRWCVSAACAGFAGFIVVSVLASVVDWVQFLYLLVYALLPIAVGVAMLRYRLYEIDVIIRRTLTYACLVVALAVVYLAGVSVIGALLRELTGSSGVVAVTISTLAVALAFQPLRRRIQRAVDHRFFRAGYDAAQAVDAFSGRLREEIDLDALSAELLAVVRRTVQPAQSTLWLRVPSGVGRRVSARRTDVAVVGQGADRAVDGGRAGPPRARRGRARRARRRPSADLVHRRVALDPRRLREAGIRPPGAGGARVLACPRAGDRPDDPAADRQRRPRAGGDAGRPERGMAAEDIAVRRLDAGTIATGLPRAAPAARRAGALPRERRHGARRRGDGGPGRRRLPISASSWRPPSGSSTSCSPTAASA